MNRAQRILLVVYLFGIAYCCVWVPWYVYSRRATVERAGYGWLWAGPKDVASPQNAAPDVPLIELRLAALTATCAAVYFALWFVPHSKQELDKKPPTI